MNLNKQLIQRILKNRFKNGFLTLSDFPKPHLLYGMNKASQLIIDAIKCEKSITVVGDYDVDGVISTAVMQTFFEHIDYEVNYIIPNRFSDGYGISEKLIDKINSDLIITVDNGISAIKAAKKCKEKNIDLIITDHHTPSDTLPDAAAIINPKLNLCNFQYSEICGAQVAWYLVAHLNTLLDAKLNIKSLIAQVSIAVIADVMPLIDLNRAFVKAGLQLLAKSKKPYILALKQNMSKEEFNASDIGFFIAPKINSAGRMDDANLALRFIMSKDINEANNLLNQLNELNSYRKDTQNEIIKEALKQVNENDTVIVVNGRWHEGVIGIVASHLSQKFKKPSIVFCENENELKGSARSYGDIDIYNIIYDYKDLLLGFGGHKGAAGLSIKKNNFKKFKEGISKKIYKQANIENFCMGELAFETIDWQLVEILQSYEPYGEKNPTPTFKTKEVKITSIKKVGSNKEHKILFLNKNFIEFKAISFNCLKEIQIGEKIDIEYKVEKNIFQNQSNIQLQIIDLVKIDL